MQQVHYAAMKFDDRWKLVGKGLRWGDFDSRDEAVAVAERVAEEARGVGLDVQLHVHDENGVLHLRA